MEKWAYLKRLLFLKKERFFSIGWDFENAFLLLY